MNLRTAARAIAAPTLESSPRVLLRVDFIKPLQFDGAEQRSEPAQRAARGRKTAAPCRPGGLAIGLPRRQRRHVTRRLRAAVAALPRRPWPERDNGERAAFAPPRLHDPQAAALRLLCQPAASFATAVAMPVPGADRRGRRQLPALYRDRRLPAVTHCGCRRIARSPRAAPTASRRWITWPAG